MATVRTPLEYVYARFEEEESQSLKDFGFIAMDEGPHAYKSKIYKKNNEQSARAVAMEEMETKVVPAFQAIFNHSLKQITRSQLSSAVKVVQSTTYTDKESKEADDQPYRILVDLEVIADLKPFDPASVIVTPTTNRPPAFAPGSNSELKQETTPSAPALDDARTDATKFNPGLEQKITAGAPVSSDAHPVVAIDNPPPSYSQVMGSDPELMPISAVDDTPDEEKPANSWGFSDFVAFAITGTIILSFFFPQVVILNQVAGYIASAAAYFGISPGILSASLALSSMLLSNRVFNFINNGIARLWYGPSQSTPRPLPTTSESKLSPSSRLSLLKNTHSSLLASKFKKVVDVAIMLDATGSMDQWIKTAKEAIKTIVNRVQDKHRDADIKIAIVGYRDYSLTDGYTCDFKSYEHGKKQYLCEYIDFTTPERATDFLAKLITIGNQDHAEAAEVGLHAVATKIQWREPSEGVQRIRNLFIVNDAPPHSVPDYHFGVNTPADLHPNPHSTPSGLYWKDMLKTLQQMGITIHTMTCGNDKTAKIINDEIAKATSGVSGCLSQPNQFMDQSIDRLDNAITEDSWELAMDLEAKQIEKTALEKLQQDAVKQAEIAREAKLQEELAKGVAQAEAEKNAAAVQLKTQDELNKVAAKEASSQSFMHKQRKYIWHAAGKNAGISAEDAEAQANSQIQQRIARYTFSTGKR